MNIGLAFSVSVASGMVIGRNLFPFFFKSALSNRMINESISTIAFGLFPSSRSFLIVSKNKIIF